MKNGLISLLLSKKMAAVLLFTAVLLFIFWAAASLQPSTIEPPAPVNEEQEKFNQGGFDYEYSKALIEFNSKYPWFDDLPPRNDDFFIGFDPSKDEFFIELYPKTDSPQSIEEQTEELKSLVTERLRAIGVVLSSYKVAWIVLPK